MCVSAIADEADPRVWQGNWNLLKNIQVVMECHDGLLGGRLLQVAGAAARGVAGTSLACHTG